ncbi:MAG: nitrogenase [Candidatus Firestonebacteria bacterium]|nr:nitrogenase [Candidatus Firestonebacteria bacterium]
MKTLDTPRPDHAYAATQNPCKLCSPLGASLVFRGLEGTVGLLHGSQGCATYIRRYLISHFKEPVDIASSNFSEETAVFGGGANLQSALDNLIRQYHPQMIAVATTCLSETIGEDVKKILQEYQSAHGPGELPRLLQVSTPSYQGTHMDGFHAAVLAVTRELARKVGTQKIVSVFPGLVSTEDLRYLKRVLRDFGLKAVLVPDYSETLDGPLWEGYQTLPPGGTPLAEMMEMGSHAAALEFATTLSPEHSAAAYLEKTFDVPQIRLDLPVGVKASDRFFKNLALIAGQAIPPVYAAARGRLLDAYADAHKHVFGVRVAIYGEEDWVIALAGFAAEIGMQPVLCASGGRSGQLRERLQERLDAPVMAGVRVLAGVDFADIETALEGMQPELLVGNSKGYALARKLKIPLARFGFPIHDRIGGQRLLHLGYEGTQRLFDQWVNILIESRQEQSPVGYAYM